MKFKTLIWVILLYCLPAFSSPWLPSVDETIIHISGTGINKPSKKYQHYLRNKYIDMQNNNKSLQEIARNIKTLAKDENRELYNSEQRAIGQINHIIEETEQKMDVLTSLNNHHFGYVFIEQNIADKQSIGVGVRHEINLNFRNNRLFRKNSLLLAHKYQFLKKNNFVMSFISKLQYSDHKSDFHSQFIDLGIAIGHSSYHKKKETYYSHGLSVRKFLNKYAAHDTGLNFSVNQGKSLGKGYFVDNYASYEYIIGDRVNRSTLYLQTSIIKKIQRPNSRFNKLSMQLGFFWKENIIYKRFYICGPFFSLWMPI